MLPPSKILLRIFHCVFDYTATKLATMVSLVSSKVVISIYGMWNPVFTETPELDVLGKQKRKWVSCREKSRNFTKLRLVYEVQNAWELRPQ